MRELGEKVEERTDISFEIIESNNFVIFEFSKKFIGKRASIYLNNELLFAAIIGKRSEIKVNKKSALGKKLAYSVKNNMEFSVKI